MSQEQINRGRALSRLLDNEDFAVLLAEWHERIGTLADAIQNWDETPMSDAHSLTRLKHRHAALRSLLEWVTDEIALGDKHRIAQENQ